MSDDTRSVQDRAAEELSLVTFLDDRDAELTAARLARAGLLADGSDARKLADRLRSELIQGDDYLTVRDIRLILDELCPPAPEPSKRERLARKALEATPEDASVPRLLAALREAGVFDDEGEA